MSARPGHPRGENPSCPQAAAAPVSECKGRLQQITLTAIREAACEGLTAHEASLATGVDRHSIQPRISELRRKGLVIPSGKRRRNPSGRTAIAWLACECVDAGLPAPSRD